MYSVPYRTLFWTCQYITSFFYPPIFSSILQLYAWPIVRSHRLTLRLNSSAVAAELPIEVHRPSIAPPSLSWSSLNSQDVEDVDQRDKMAMKMETLHELVARATNDSPTSLSGLVSTLIPAGIIAGVMVLAFFILRRTQQRIYSPRSYVSSLREQERSPSLPTGMFNWIRAFWQVPDDYILTHNSMDGYLVVRYLKMCVVMMFVGALITWPILFPINITGGGNGGQLDMLSMANVTHPIRYYAHTAVAWLYFTFILAMITRECIFYIGLRQAYLLSPVSSFIPIEL